MGKDKILHSLACFVATLASYGFMRMFFSFAPSVTSSWFLPVGLGIGKEYGDSKATGNKWDWEDIVADLIGTLLAVFVILLVQWFS